ARHGNATAEEFAQPAGDGEAEAGAAEAAGRALIRLPEAVEDLLRMLGRDADACVDHVDDNSALPPPHTQFHRSGFGEFDGVAEQVDEDLAELAFVADHEELCGDGAREREAAGARG